MSRDVMWYCFSQFVRKLVVTFTFKRTGVDVADYNVILEKLTAAKDTGGLVCTSPIAIKSLNNKFVETVHFLIANAADAKGVGQQQRQLADRCATWHEEARVLSEIMKLWGKDHKGILLIDEGSFTRSSLARHDPTATAQRAAAVPLLPSLTCPLERITNRHWQWTCSCIRSDRSSTSRSATRRRRSTSRRCAGTCP